ncbi:MAG: GHKL domain-containing protein, partial [Bacillota bacterium]|nr:GHKL domain-containing protein [Bacillota bacterium]
YSDSFRGLIDHIRLRQHEFDNHINTIYSQHYIHKNYEDLITAQKSYCDVIMKENRFNKLLSGGNPIIIGFLYGKFVEIEKLGVEVSYKVVGVEDELDVPVHKIVEILGDLINNGVEALLADKERNKLYVSVIGANGLYIEVRNESAHISYEEFDNFFAKDYSQKGENRGLGLYNVKQICDEYHMEISCDNKEVDGLNWLYFAIRKEKETI